MPRRRLFAYLESLPAGARSFSECRVRGEVLDATLEWLAEVESAPDPVLEDWLQSQRPMGKALEWIPEVLLNAVSLQIVDDGYPSDESWLNEVYRRQRAVYQTPLYRALLLVLSPTLLTMGAQDRWKAYRTGSELVVDRWTREGSRRLTTATLRYPPGLHTETHLLSLGEAIHAAVDACGARESRLELLSAQSRPGEARLRLSYEA
ncbi:MAG TPA: hypothetical protein RMH99_20725 [Sandaracinaceae bacterium LLY-WYZ-13_1]|nr:hypothetical protein [Sandaracinaceae bacterium LLY-WYZ-13_1]